MWAANFLRRNAPLFGKISNLANFYPHFRVRRQLKPPTPT